MSRALVGHGRRREETRRRFSVEGAICSVSGANCVCTATINDGVQTVSGTYSISGTTITVTPSGGEAATEGYCVQGNTLTLTGMATTTMPLSVGEVVLTRQ